MSLFETGASSGAVSLQQLFAGHCPAVPAQQDRSLKAANRAARDYLEQVRQVDLSRAGDRNRDPVRVGTLHAGRRCQRR